MSLCHAVPNAIELLEIMSNHQQLKDELKALVFSSKVVHLFYDIHRKRIDVQTFALSLQELLKSVEILKDEQTMPDGTRDIKVLSILSCHLNSSELQQESLIIEQSPTLIEITRNICLAGLEKLSDLMRAEELKNLDHSWPMTMFRPTNSAVESAFGLLKACFTFNLFEKLIHLSLN